jgi:bifunctional non-homologous end joining protein LigD
MNEEISLYYTDGSSNKEYHAQLLVKDDGYVVNFQYGRRGAALQAGTKTAAPLPYEKAKKTYDKLVAEKMGKGYTPAESGVAFQDTGFSAVNTNNIPQLLNPVDESEISQLINDDGWGMQEKFDGKRGMAEINDGVVGSNRKGLQVALPVSVSTPLALCQAHTLIDGELIGEVFFAFDCLSNGNQNMRDKGYAERYAALEKIVSSINSSNIVLAYLAVGSANKRTLYENMKRNKREGVVFKKLDAPYVSGRPTSGGNQLKFKFVEMATCRVASVHASKRSVGVELMDETSKWIGVGNVTIPTNKIIPTVNDLVEIRYLYAYKGGSLYQPFFIGRRDDQDVSACVMTQLKYKSEGYAEESEDGQ